MDRRDFLRVAGSASLLAVGGGLALSGCVYGPLQAADANGVRLPRNFTSRVVARTGEAVAGTGYVWHSAPDGGATFATGDGGWVYVSNSEVGSGAGGVSMIRFDAGGAIVDARRICAGTSRNCAGGATPWGTWLTCEEVANGQVWECDPLGVAAAVARPALGRFNHEAAAVDPVAGHVYLTEDQPDGGLYRFVPNAYPDLSAGTLEVLTETAGVLGWATVPDPSGATLATRKQVAAMKRFAGGEGACWRAGVLVFTTKGDNRVWAYDTVADALTVRYDDNSFTSPTLTGVDNVTVRANGDLYVAEDGGDMQLVLIAPSGEVEPFLQVVGADTSEITGPAFSPDGTRLYVSSQRLPGTTYEITGPFRG